MAVQKNDNHVTLTSFIHPNEGGKPSQIMMKPPSLWTSGRLYIL